MIDFSKPVQTRDGRKVRVICTDRKNKHYPVIALVVDYDGNKESVMCFTKDGLFFRDDDDLHVNGNDLIQAPQHHKHHDVIIAWAKGAQVQCKSQCGVWRDIRSDDHPHWIESLEYRVKPE